MVELLINGVAYPIDSIEKIEIGFDASKLTDATHGRDRDDISFEVTLSEDNCALFGADILPHNASKFNDSYQEAAITVDGQSLLEGQILLNGVKWSGDDITATFTILGTTDSWSHSIALSTFNSINIEYNKQLVDATIKESWEEGSIIAFVPVTRDEATLDVSSSQSYPIVEIKGVTDYHPFLHIGSLVNAIFNDTDYTLKSNFIDGELFNKLYMSGSYAYTESTTAQSRMGFYVSRVDDVSTTVGYGGRVYASTSITSNSVGSFVDMDSITERDDCYSNGGVLSQSSSGAVEFTSLYSTNVGFEFRFAYVTPYRIESRDTLSCINRIYVGDSIQFEFSLVNNYEDKKSTTLTENFSYTLVIFDHESSTEYVLSYYPSLTVISRSYDNTVSFSTTMSSEVILLQRDGYDFVQYSGDWAIYSGWITQGGEAEIDVTFTSPPKAMSSGSVQSFDNIIFDGGEQGDSFTLLERSYIRPIFASYPGYGSYFSFEDIARHDITQATLFESLQHLFNLRFYTDRVNNNVYIEPRDDFYNAPLWDWSDRVIIDEGFELSPLAANVSEKRVWRYLQGEASMEEYMDASVDEYGVWSYGCDSQIAIEGTTTNYNPLFYPSANDSDGVLYVGERYDDSTLDTLNITPRVVIRDGYIQTSNQGDMPYVTFHDTNSTLCFEDRDSLQGLNQYYLNQTQIESRSEEITLSIRLAPEEFRALFTLDNPYQPSIQGQFTLSLDGEECCGTIERIEWYDTTQYIARITFQIIN